MFTNASGEDITKLFLTRSLYGAFEAANISSRVQFSPICVVAVRFAIYISPFFIRSLMLSILFLYDSFLIGYLFVMDGAVLPLYIVWASNENDMSDGISSSGYAKPFFRPYSLCKTKKGVFVSLKGYFLKRHSILIFR